jgi:hypothetical protein
MSDTFLVRLADGTTMTKRREDLQDDDRIVIDGPEAFADLDAARHRLDVEIEEAGGLDRWRALVAEENHR